MVDSSGLSLEAPAPMMPSDADTEMVTMASAMTNFAMSGLSSVGPEPSGAPDSSEGLSGVFDGALDVASVAGDFLGGGASFDAPTPDPAPASFVSPPEQPDSPTAFSSPGPPPDSASVPMASEGFGGFHLGSLDVGLPPAAGADAPGVVVDQQELMNFQLSLVPPDPVEETFPVSVDAPASASAPAYASSPGDYQASARLGELEAISERAFGPVGSSHEAVGRGAAAGHSVTIQNLHLPAARGAQFLDELLAYSTGTNADLTGLG
jgi:hypothetical protein